LEALFGGGSRRKGRTRRKGQDTQYVLEISLAELYTGDLKHFDFTRKVVCPLCTGRGLSETAVIRTCPTCKGSGSKMTLRSPRSGYVQTLHTVCPECVGRGEVVNPEDICSACRGEKVIQEKDRLDIVIEKGMKDGDTLVFAEQGDQLKDTSPGDVIILIKQTDDPQSQWKRTGTDLEYFHSITLIEALTGFEFYLTHLDGRVLHVCSEPRTIITPGESKVIPNEGMPLRENPMLTGNLYIHPNIEFPTQLSKEQCQGLKQLLPGGQALPPLQNKPPKVTAVQTDVQFVGSKKRPAPKKDTNSHSKKWYHPFGHLFDNRN